MKKGSQLFYQQIKELSRKMTIDLEAVKNLLDVTLTQDESETNDFITQYYGKPRKGGTFEGAIQSVDFRVPKKPGVGPFLLVEIKPEISISATELEKRFGSPDKIEANPPPNPVSGMYLYRGSIGFLRFGLDQDNKVVSASIDRTE